LASDWHIYLDTWPSPQFMLAAIAHREWHSAGDTPDAVQAVGAPVTDNAL
jgi:hypothetical protein